MCRLVALMVSDFNLLRESILKLRDSSRSDPMGPSGIINHSDGWGLAIVRGSLRNGGLLYYKSTKPMYNDENLNNVIESIKDPEGAIYSGVAHALNAYDKSVVSELTIHPINTHVNDGEIYVVHNGVVDKLKVYDYLRVKYGVKVRVEHLNDTYVLALLIARIYDDYGELSDALSKVAELTRANNWLKSALNMGIMHIAAGDSIRVYVTSMYSREVLSNEKRRKYFNIFIVRSNSGVVAASSTLVRVYGLGSGNAEEVEPRQDELVFCRLSLGNVDCGAA